MDNLKSQCAVAQAGSNIVDETDTLGTKHPTVVLSDLKMHGRGKKNYTD